MEFLIKPFLHQEFAEFYFMYAGLYLWTIGWVLIALCSFVPRHAETIGGLGVLIFIIGVLIYIGGFAYNEHRRDGMMESLRQIRALRLR